MFYFRQAFSTIFFFCFYSFYFFLFYNHGSFVVDSAKPAEGRSQGLGQRGHDLNVFSLFLLQSVWFVFGFLVSLPPAISLKCYRQHCSGTAGSAGCSTSSRTQEECRGNQDRCLTVNMDYNSIKYYQCASSSGQDCNTTAVCSDYQLIANAVDKPFGNCVANCCSTDLCNDSSEFSALFCQRHIK